MSKVIVTSQVQDPAKWEAGFRTHADVFRKYTLRAPVHFSVSGNEVTICFEPDNLETFKNMVSSPETQAAMVSDGVKRETLKMTVLEKELKL
ncbi:MAG: hypothetical protein WA871_04185 [Candidatus Acidiferrales bacterium]